MVGELRNRDNEVIQRFSKNETEDYIRLDTLLEAGGFDDGYLDQNAKCEPWSSTSLNSTHRGCSNVLILFIIKYEQNDDFLKWRTNFEDFKYIYFVEEKHGEGKPYATWTEADIDDTYTWNEPTLHYLAGLNGVSYEEFKVNATMEIEDARNNAETAYYVDH
eukprot:UN31900